MHTPPVPPGDAPASPDDDARSPAVPLADGETGDQAGGTTQGPAPRDDDYEPL